MSETKFVVPPGMKYTTGEGKKTGGQMVDVDPVKGFDLVRQGLLMTEAQFQAKLDHEKALAAAAAAEKQARVAAVAASPESEAAKPVTSAETGKKGKNAPDPLS